LAVPLKPKQKFEAGLERDPLIQGLGVTAAVAELSSATKRFDGYGQEAQGYSQRATAALAIGYKHVYGSAYCRRFEAKTRDIL